MTNLYKLMLCLCRQVIVFEWLILLLALPLFLFPTPIRSLILFILPLLWMIRKVAHGIFVPSTPLDWPLFGLLLMVLVSLYATYDISLSFPKVSGILFGVALFYGVVAAVEETRHRLWMATSTSGS